MLMGTGPFVVLIKRTHAAEPCASAARNWPKIWRFWRTLPKWIIVLNLVSLTSPSSACLTAPIVENGTHAVVSIQPDSRILVMMGRNSVAAKRLTTNLFYNVAPGIDCSHMAHAH